MKKIFAFTLAETLIVIGIIGVVASLTIPNLNSSTADREKVTKIKKVYANLTEAFARAEAVYGDVNQWPNVYNYDLDNGATQSTLFGGRVTEFMKLQKDCNMVSDSNNSCYLTNDNSYTVVTADGTTIEFSYGAVITVDLDGAQKGKNEDGVDRFRFVVDKPERQLYALKEPSGNLTKNINALTQWVITNGNMDYKKATYAGNKYTCPDSNIILDWSTNTSCK